MWKLGVLSSAPPREVMNNLLIVLKEVEMKVEYVIYMFIYQNYYLSICIYSQNCTHTLTVEIFDDNLSTSMCFW